MERWQGATRPLTVKYNEYVECKQGPAVRKPISSDLGLKFNQGSCFSYWKEFSQHISSGSLKASKVKMWGENYLQESVSFDCNIEFKIDTNPGLA